MSSYAWLVLQTVSFAAMLGATPLASARASAWGKGELKPQRSIVKVLATSDPLTLLQPWQAQRPLSTWVGAGVVIEGNRVLTNAHVVDEQPMIEVRLANGGRRFTAQVSHICHSCDLALLSVDEPEFLEHTSPLEIGDLPRLKQDVTLYGFPVGGEGLSVTQGIVSRLEVDYYVHSMARFLSVQVDAAMNPGNSGGPALSKGKVIGISFQSLPDADGIAYLIPPPVIEHFLADVADGEFDGFPELGVHVQTLENASLRRALALPQDVGGVLVTGVARGGAAHGVLRPGDVVLAIDGIPIQADNTVVLENEVAVHASHVEHTHQVGDVASVRVFRDGAEQEVSVKMSLPIALVAPAERDEEPPYRAYGGLVFQPLTQAYLSSFEPGWAPPHLTLYAERGSLGPYQTLLPGWVPDRRELVVVTGVLASQFTRGYGWLQNEVVHSVNGTPVRDLEHLSDLLDDAETEFVQILTEGGGLVVLDRERAESLNPSILESYEIGSDRAWPRSVPASLAEGQDEGTSD